MLPARTDPKPEYAAPAGLRGKRCLTEHVHGCLHCPRLICQQHVSCLQQKNAKNYRFFAILQSPHVIFTARLNQHRSAPQDLAEEQLRKLATLPRLTDEEYLSRRKRFERDEIFTQYAVGVVKKILHISLIHAIVNAGGVMTGHAGHAFSPRPPAVLF